MSEKCLTVCFVEPLGVFLGYLQMMSIGIDCSNASATEQVLQLLKLREQAIKSYELLKDLSIAMNYNEEYVTWLNKVESNFNNNETRGLFGSFPFYSSSCRYCNFRADQCPKPHG